MTRRMARQLLVLPSEVQDEEREERGRGRDRIRSVRVTRIRREENNKKPRKERGEDVPMWREIRLEGPGIEAGWAKEGLNEQREAEQVRMVSHPLPSSFLHHFPPSSFRLCLALTECSLLVRRSRSQLISSRPLKYT